MEEFLVPLAFFGSIVAIVIFITSRRNRERIEMIRKGMVPNKYITKPQLKTGSRTLFWGILAVAIGLALVISSVFIQKNFDRDMMTIALLFLCGGGAMLLYWKLTAKDREHARRLQEEHLARTAEGEQLPINKEEKPESGANLNNEIQ